MPHLRGSPRGLGGKGSGDAGAVYNDGNDFFGAIIKAEGTGKHGNPYDTSLGYMKSPKPLTEMTMAESLAWGDQIRRAQGLNSSAKGAFQIVNTTQRLAMRALGLGPDDLFNRENQRRMASWIARKQGLGAWEGFKKHPGERARAQAAMGVGRDRDFADPPSRPDSAPLSRMGDSLMLRGAGAQQIKGDARLHISMDGLPRGAKFSTDMSGMFKEVKTERGRPMADRDK
jgi:hypothetical protein